MGIGVVGFGLPRVSSPSPGPPARQAAGPVPAAPARTCSDPQGPPAGTPPPPPPVTHDDARATPADRPSPDASPRAGRGTSRRPATAEPSRRGGHESAVAG